MYKKLFVTTVCVLCVTAALCCCNKNNNDNPIVDVNSSDEALLKLQTEKEERSLACGNTFTVASCISGDILIAGNCKSIYRDISELYGAYRIEAGEDVLAGIMPDGTVHVIGDAKELYAQSMQWTNMKDIAFGKGFMVGVRCDGTVVACGDNAMGQCDVEDIRRAVDVAAGASTAVIVKNDGSVLVKGAYADNGETGRWTDIKEAACGDGFIIGLRSDGTAEAYNNEAVKAWKNIKSIEAWGEAAAAIDAEGKILTTAEYAGKVAGVEKADDFSLGQGFLAVRTGDEVQCFGEKNDLQGDTKWWDTGLVLNESGYITGFAEKTPTAQGKKLISDTVGEPVELYLTDGTEFRGEYIGTGIHVKNASGEEKGITLIYGDLNGDGAISEADSLVLSDYMSDNSLLTGVYLEAAHASHYVSDTKPIGEKDKMLIEEHVRGTAHIKQYVHDPYRTKLQESYKINSDVVGYIKVKNTNIDYPILYGGTEFYYHDHTIRKTYSGLGSIYAIHGFYRKNNTVIGHNGRRSETMFHDLHKIQNRGEDLLVFKNRVIGVTIYHEYSLWELYALYETGPDEPVSTQLSNLQTMDGWTDERIQSWIDAQISRSEINLNVRAEAEDTLLTLYTCGDRYYSDPDTQARLYLFFRRVG